VARIRGCRSIVGVASIVTCAKPACAARAVSPSAPEAPVDVVVAAIDLAGLVELDAAVARDSEGFHQHPPSRCQHARQPAQQAERVLDAMEDPEAHDHVEALTAGHQPHCVAAHVLDARVQQRGDRAKTLTPLQLDPQRALTQATYCSLSTATTRAAPRCSARKA
jgi:hypothetical protein